jgi:hypothetical protein
MDKNQKNLPGSGLGMALRLLDIRGTINWLRESRAPVIRSLPEADNCLGESAFAFDDRETCHRLLAGIEINEWEPTVPGYSDLSPPEVEPEPGSALHPRNGPKKGV